MRAAAQVDELDRVAVSATLRYTDTPPSPPDFARVLGVGLAGAHLLDDLALVRLVGEHVERGVVGDLVAHEALVALDDLAHLASDAPEVVVAEGLAVGELEVVVEAVGDRGPDRVLRAREQVGDGLGEHVRGRVAQHLAAVVGVGRDDLRAWRRGRAGGSGSTHSPSALAATAALARPLADRRRDVGRRRARRGTRGSSRRAA